jgi:hypothetical protein
LSQKNVHIIERRCPDGIWNTILGKPLTWCTLFFGMGGQCLTMHIHKFIKSVSWLADYIKNFSISWSSNKFVSYLFDLCDKKNIKIKMISRFHFVNLRGQLWIRN